MSKSEQIEYMRKNWKPIQKDEVVDGVIPFTKVDVEDETSLMDSVREHKRDEFTNRHVLTSDEMS